MAGRRLILTLHGIGEPPSDASEGEREVWIDRSRLDSALDFAAGRDDVTITFDDGNRSDVEVALPALRERGLTAMFFVVAGRLDQDGFLSRDDLRELLDAGMTIGSHGLDHEPWRNLAVEELADQLTRARSALEEVVERPVSEASCPFGDYGRGVLRTLRRLGYERVYTSDGGMAPETSWLQPRNTVLADGPVSRGADSLPAGTRLLKRAKVVAKRWR